MVSAVAGLVSLSDALPLISRAPAACALKMKSGMHINASISFREIMAISLLFLCAL
jgi:hypothetical protein